MEDMDLSRLESALRLCRASRKKLKTTSEARRLLPAGSSRARVTTANARWARAAEAHDRNILELMALCGQIVKAP